MGSSWSSVGRSATNKKENSQRRECFAVTETEPSLLHGKIIGIDSENHKGHNGLCGWMRISLTLLQVVYIITTDISKVGKRVPEIWTISTNYLPTTLTKKDPIKTRGKIMNFVLYFFNWLKMCWISAQWEKINWRPTCSGSEHTECFRYQQWNWKLPQLFWF